MGAYANSWLVLWFIQHFLLKLCITRMLQWWWCWSAFVFSDELPFIIIIIIQGGVCTCIVMLKEQVIMTDATSEFHCPVMNYNKESRWKGCGRYGQVLTTFFKMIPYIWLQYTEEENQWHHTTTVHYNYKHIPFHAKDNETHSHSHTHTHSHPPPPPTHTHTNRITCTHINVYM